MAKRPRLEDTTTNVRSVFCEQNPQVECKDKDCCDVHCVDGSVTLSAQAQPWSYLRDLNYLLIMHRGAATEVDFRPMGIRLEQLQQVVLFMFSAVHMDTHGNSSGMLWERSISEMKNELRKDAKAIAIMLTLIGDPTWLFDKVPSSCFDNPTGVWSRMMDYPSRSPYMNPGSEYVGEAVMITRENMSSFSTLMYLPSETRTSFQIVRPYRDEIATYKSGEMDKQEDPHMNLILSRLVGRGSERIPTIADWIHLIESGFMFSTGKYTDKTGADHVVDFAPNARSNSRYIVVEIDEAMTQNEPINAEGEEFHHGIELFPSPQMCDFVIG